MAKNIPSKPLAPKRPPQKRKTSALYLIGLYKLFECVLFIAVGVGIHRLLNRNLAEFVLHWFHVLRIDPDNHYIHLLTTKIFAISPKQLRLIGFGTYFYAAMHLIEGVGLVSGTKWGEWVTVISTGAFIPLEIWEMIRHLTPLRAGTFALNVLILAYLIWNLRQRSRS